MFLGHFACRRCIPILLLAYGMWGKLSDRTEIPDHGSSPEQQSDNLGARFLSDAEKCCVSLLPAHCRVSKFRFQPARRGVSRRHNLLCPANGIRLGPWSSQKVAVDAEVNEVLDVLVVLSSRGVRMHSRPVRKVAGGAERSSQLPFVRVAHYRIIRALAGCGRHCAILFASELPVVCGGHTQVVHRSHLFRDASPEGYRSSWLHSEIPAFSSRRQSLIP